MKLYRLKHIPTGLYYKPYTYGGSNLSTVGKIYHTSTHGLSSAIKYNEKEFSISVNKTSKIYKKTKDILLYSSPRFGRYNEVVAKTLVSDWEIEYITINDEILSDDNER